MAKSSSIINNYTLKRSILHLHQLKYSLDIFLVKEICHGKVLLVIGKEHSYQDTCQMLFVNKPLGLSSTLDIVNVIEISDDHINVDFHSGNYVVLIEGIERPFNYLKISRICVNSGKKEELIKREIGISSNQKCRFRCIFEENHYLGVVYFFCESLLDSQEHEKITLIVLNCQSTIKEIRKIDLKSIFGLNLSDDIKGICFTSQCTKVAIITRNHFSVISLISKNVEQQSTLDCVFANLKLSYFERITIRNIDMNGLADDILIAFTESGKIFKLDGKKTSIIESPIRTMGKVFLCPFNKCVYIYYFRRNSIFIFDVQSHEIHEVMLLYYDDFPISSNGFGDEFYLKDSRKKNN